MAKLPITDFLTARLKEYDPNFEVRKGTGFEQLFFKPLQYMLQPIVDETVLLTTSQSFLRILQQDSPDTFSEEAVDALASNLFVTRTSGSVSSGSARVYYTEAVAREWPATGAQFTGSNGLLYTNTSPFAVSKAQVSEQVENGLFYYDIPVTSVDTGTDTQLGIAGIISIDNDSAAITVSNAAAITGGTARETNTELIARVRRSISVRDLVTGKGFDATMFENFAGFLSELRAIGFGDPEMMRDIVYNTHIGGKVDGYFKTPAITQGHKNFVGVLPDSTRQAFGSTNLTLYGTDSSATVDGNFDTSSNKRPIIEQIYPASAARYLSPIDLSSPVDLSGGGRARITIDGYAIEMSIVGSIPASTTRYEIINVINQNFGYVVAFSVGSSLELRSSTKGRTSIITIAPPNIGSSAVLAVFGLSSTQTFNGDGPITFTEGVHYSINPLYGSVARMAGSVINPIVTTGKTEIGAGRSIFYDSTSAVFSSVAANDIITVNPNSPNLPWGNIVDPMQGIQVDYRVTAKIDNNTLVIDEVPHYKGTWTASDNLPFLRNGTGTTYDIYKVTTAGACNFGAGIIPFVIGDYVRYYGGLWQKASRGTWSAATNIPELVNEDGVEYDNYRVTTPGTINFGDVGGVPTLDVVFSAGDYVQFYESAWRKIAGTDETGIEYVVRRTGIKNGERIYAQYWFNPLSLDIGPQVWYTDESTVPSSQKRGIRPGREDHTLTDMVLLRINSIDIVDPITTEPTGEVLATGGGYGQGGFGEGGYGGGGGSDYQFVVNSPHERFSVFEDSMIIFHPALIGLSFRVNYDYVPEGVTMHNFCRSDSERVLDADILIKHFIPAYVSGTIHYKVDSTDSTIPTNDALTLLVKEFISSQGAGKDLKISDVYQFISRSTDPFDKYTSYVKPFELTAAIHNVDGSTTVVSSKDILVVPAPVPFPKDTTRQLSARITHWIGDNIVLVRDA